MSPAGEKVKEILKKLYPVLREFHAAGAFDLPASDQKELEEWTKKEFPDVVGMLDR